MISFPPPYIFKKRPDFSGRFFFLRLFCKAFYRLFRAVKEVRVK